MTFDVVINTSEGLKINARLIWRVRARDSWKEGATTVKHVKLGKSSMGLARC